MGVFHVFKIVQKVPNCATYHTYDNMGDHAFTMSTGEGGFGGPSNMFADSSAFKQ